MHLLEDYLGYDATSSSNCRLCGTAVLIEEVIRVLTGKLALEWVSLFMQL